MTSNRTIYIVYFAHLRFVWTMYVHLKHSRSRAIWRTRYVLTGNAIIRVWFNTFNTKSQNDKGNDLIFSNQQSVYLENLICYGKCMKCANTYSTGKFGRSLKYADNFGSISFLIAFLYHCTISS